MPLCRACCSTAATMPNSRPAPQDKAAKAWLGDCVASAHWLVKALDQRARTIVKVASEIVTQQQGFFEHGVAALRPLTLAKVAEAIEMHESTVSRVTSNKYLACDRGLFELKYFFGSGVAQRRRRGRGGRSGQGRDRQADRRRDRHPERRHAGRPAQGPGLRPRPPHRRQISRGDRASARRSSAGGSGRCGEDCIAAAQESALRPSRAHTGRWSLALRASALAWTPAASIRSELATRMRSSAATGRRA